MNSRPLLALALALALPACGEDPAPQDARLPDPDAYFGLAPCTCRVYAADNETGRVGVSIERAPIDLGGVLVYELRFRDSIGVVFRTEYVRATSPDLELHELQDQGGTPTWRMNGGLPLVRWPPDRWSADPILAAIPAEYRPGAATPTPFDLRLRSDYGTAQDVSFQRGEAPETARGYRVTYQLTTEEAGVQLWHQGARTFVPEVGFVQFEELATSSGPNRTWRLRRIFPLEQGENRCPYENAPIPTQLCGQTLID